jgi:hypothetical protein
MGDMLPQSQPLTVPIKGKFDAQPAVPPGATARHAGDTLWPWLLGLVLIGGLGFVIYKAVSKRQAPGLPAGSTPDAIPASAASAVEVDDGGDEGGDGGVYMLGGRRRARFASATPVQFRYPPRGYRRGARVKRLSEEQFTKPSSGRYNLEVED